MNHVNLDTQVETVIKQFVLSLAVNPNGTVLEADGQAIAHLVPLISNNGTTAHQETAGKRLGFIETRHPELLDDSRRVFDELLQLAVRDEDPDE
jgi:hypothetical protein